MKENHNPIILLLEAQDIKRYAGLLAIRKKVDKYEKRILPKLVHYYQVLPRLFDRSTDEGKMFYEAFNKFLDTGDTDALEIYLQMNMVLVQGQKEKLPLNFYGEQ